MVRYGPEAIGKLARVWLESAILVPAVDVLPAVVQYDIVIAQVPQPQIDHPLRRGQEQVLGHIATKCIPVVLVRSASAFRKECGSRKKSKRRRTHPIGGVRASPFLIASEPTTSAAATDKRARNGHMLLLFDGVSITHAETSGGAEQYRVYRSGHCRLPFIIVGPDIR